MRLAVIDCGTNTFNLIVVELLDKKKYQKLFSTRISVKLGEDAINKNLIAEKPFNRGVEAIARFKENTKALNVDKILAFATSAIREASNGNEFVEQVKKQLNVDINVIDGNREAELIYFGIKEAVTLGDSVSLIMDIGGGSTEFILANKGGLLWKQSFKVGTARLLEKFFHSNPITTEEINNINQHLNAELVSLFKAVKKYNPVELVGSSGAFESLIEMIHGELGGEVFKIERTEYEIMLADHFKISELVKRSTLEQRKKIKGLVSMRFDMIVISCLMVDFVLNSFRLKKLRVSTYALKEGALIDYINQLHL